MAGADAWGCGSAATRVLRLDPRAAAAAVDDGEGDPAMMGHVEGADAVEGDDDDGAAAAGDEGENGAAAGADSNARLMWWLKMTTL